MDPAAGIQNMSQPVTLKVCTTEDLNCRVHPLGSTIVIPALDATFRTSYGVSMTFKDVVSKWLESTRNLQPNRKKVKSKGASRLEEFSRQLRDLLRLERPFTVILDDPSGNGCIKTPLAPKNVPLLEMSNYKRTAEQNDSFGLSLTDGWDEKGAVAVCQCSSEPTTEPSSGQIGTGDVVTFKVDCHSCCAQCDMNVTLIDIPHFKQVVLMTTACPACGYKESEIQITGDVAPKGRIQRLKLSHPSDLTRVILVSKTAEFSIPKLELEYSGSTLGNRLTNLEGFLLAMKEQLSSIDSFIPGNNTPTEGKHSQLAVFLEKLGEIAAGKVMGITLELTDPAGNSYIENFCAPDDDPAMEVIDYERTAEENDSLGLTDMNTTDYENAAAKTNDC